MISSAAHLPSLILVIGYFLFWIEMWIHPGPHTTWAGWIFLGAAAFPVLRRELGSLRRCCRPVSGFFEWACIAIGGVLLCLALAQAFLPPHLGQEGDALNYHYTLARQHLILGSFSHLPWSAADLWPMPLQFALAPYWFATALPNKIPQILFLIGLIAVAVRLARRLSSRRSAPWVTTAVILGSHGLNIQFGSAMLDIPTAFLGLAALDSWLTGDALLGGIELAFYAWSKSFMPIQTAAILITLALLRWMSRRFDWHITLGVADTERSAFSWPKPWPFLRSFVLAGIIIGGPFLGKSLIYAGTPLFPFYPLIFEGRLAKDPLVRKALLQSSNLQIKTRNAYGQGRSMRAFARHVWAVAVPSKGVNNAFDYPLGLPCLLLAGPFLALQWRAMRQSRVSVLGVLALLLWGLWWMGSQQSRWLYFPLVLISIVVSGVDSIAEDGVLQGCLGIALLLSTLSLTRAYREDLRHWPRPVLRSQDRALLERSRSIPVGQWLAVSDKEAAYSECEVNVQYEDPYWVLPLKP